MVFSILVICQFRSSSRIFEEFWLEIRSEKQMTACLHCFLNIALHVCSKGVRIVTKIYYYMKIVMYYIFIWFVCILHNINRWCKIFKYLCKRKQVLYSLSNSSSIFIMIYNIHKSGKISDGIFNLAPFEPNNKP